MFIAVAKTCRQQKCPARQDWIKKKWYIYKMKYSSAIIKDEIVPFTTTWMDSENTMLSEIRQSEEAKSHMILLI